MAEMARRPQLVMCRAGEDRHGPQGRQHRSPQSQLRSSDTSHRRQDVHVRRSPPRGAPCGASLHRCCGQARQPGSTPGDVQRAQGERYQGRYQGCRGDLRWRCHWRVVSAAALLRQRREGHSEAEAARGTRCRRASVRAQPGLPSQAARVVARLLAVLAHPPCALGTPLPTCSAAAWDTVEELSEWVPGGPAGCSRDAPHVCE